MFNSVYEDMRQMFRSGHMINRLIIINVVMFILLHMAAIVIGISNASPHGEAINVITEYFAISRDLWFDITHPWVIITHMFTHIGFFHIIFNLLLLYWFGIIVGDLIGDKHILPLYILGGLTGALVYFIVAQWLYPQGSTAIGASAAVMAIAVAAASINPNHNMRLILLGNVRIKYIVLGLLIFDIISISNQSNTGGHFAHLGGAFFGWFYIKMLNEGQDLSIGINGTVESIVNFFRKKPEKSPLRVVKKEKVFSRTKDQKQKKNKNMKVVQSDQEKLDAILDKISTSGMDSLSDEEKEFLQKLSKN